MADEWGGVQREAVFALYMLLDGAYQAGLPQITWTVPAAGAGLVGRCLTWLQWRGWTQFLGCSGEHLHTHDGRVQLDADVKLNDGRVHVALVADLAVEP